MNKTIALSVLLVGSICFARRQVTEAIKHRLQPRVVEQAVWHPDHCDVTRDPLACQGERLVVENPLLRPAIVTVHCGGEAEYTENEVEISGRSSQEVLIEFSIPWAFPACKISSWR